MTSPGPTAAIPQSVLEALRLILPRNAFSEGELEEIATLCELRSYAAEHALIREGDASDKRVFFLLAGSVAVSIQNRFILRLHNRGDSIGEMGLISAAPRSATVTTESEVEALILDASLPEQDEDASTYKLRYYLSRIFNTILTEKLRVTSDRARMYEDMVHHSLRVEDQRRSLEDEIAAYLQQISLYSHLVNSARDAILITDTSGRILNANPALLRTFGIETDAVIGIEVGTLLGLPQVGPQCWERVAETARTRGWNGELVVYQPELGAISADCSVSAVYDPDLALRAYSVILRDIRERKALEAQTRGQAAELEQAYSQLRDLDRVKNNFLSMVSHELRTPISSILAYSELLSGDMTLDPADQQQFVSVIHKETQVLSEMVNKVLAISKMQSGEMLFEFAEADLEEPLCRLAAMMRSRADAKQVALDVTVPAPLRPVVFDEGNLTEAVGQLLDNAIKYTDTGSICLEITQNDRESLIRVSDTGKGVEGKNIEALLETFGRGDPVNISGHGLGLGLPLCYLIVKAHAGTLRLQSGPGKGTEAVITLPMRSSGAPEAE